MQKIIITMFMSTMLWSCGNTEVTDNMIAKKHKKDKPESSKICGTVKRVADDRAQMLVNNDESKTPIVIKVSSKDLKSDLKITGLNSYSYMCIYGEKEEVSALDGGDTIKVDKIKYVDDNIVSF